MVVALVVAVLVVVVAALGLSLAGSGFSSSVVSISSGRSTTSSISLFYSNDFFHVLAFPHLLLEVCLSQSILISRVVLNQKKRV